VLPAIVTLAALNSTDFTPIGAACVIVAGATVGAVKE
jgi:hypothetical protein